MAICLKTSSALAASLFALVILGCGPKAEFNQPGQSRTTGMTIETTLKRHTDKLMAIPGVVGTAVGQCDGRPCILVLVVKKSPDLMQKIPRELEGYPVTVEETGAIRSLDKEAGIGRR
jgi:hypothetical protein